MSLARTLLAVSTTFSLACSSGSPDAAGDDTTAARIASEVAAAAQQAGVPGADEVAAASAVKDHDSGGRHSVKLAGGIAATVDSRDASFCARSMDIGKGGTGIIAFSLVGNQYSISITGTGRALEVGTTPIGTDRNKGYMVQVIDRRASIPKFWDADSGELTLTSVSADRVAGRYKLTAKSPDGGAPTTAEGDFQATKGC